MGTHGRAEEFEARMSWFWSRNSETTPAACADLIGMLVLAVLSLGPLLAGTRSAGPDPTSWHSLLGKGTVFLAMGLPIALTVRGVGPGEPWAGRVWVFVLVLAALATAWHAYHIDRIPDNERWQREAYLAILQGLADAPHQYRALPYGLVRGLELLTGDWSFACLVYRWYFTAWFLWVWYRFARLFHTPSGAILTLAAFPLLYPPSVAFYRGQLTDPQSHFLFAAALIYGVRDRPVRLGLALALGILAKETVVLMVPAYAACQMKQGWRCLLRAMGLGAVCVAAFLAVRLPLGWRPGYEALNGTNGLMVTSNLGIGPPLYESEVPMLMNYLHPLLFIGSFLPFVALRWKWTDDRLKGLFLVLTPLLLASSLCFSWLCESRNYMPLLPLLTTMALAPSAGRLNDSS
jgi:hypothetical protein